MSTLLNDAINAVSESDKAFCHFIVDNEVGSTGGHQCGFLIPRRVWSMFFDSPGEKGSNKDKFVRIHWPEGLITDSRAIYYGVGTRNEYRLTRFGKGFPYLDPDRSGDLLVLAHYHDDEYKGFVLSADEDIDTFMAHFNISPQGMGDLIQAKALTPEDRLFSGIQRILAYIIHIPRGFARSFAMHMLWRQQIAAQEEVAL